jgi:hypothetical protein
MLLSFQSAILLNQFAVQLLAVTELELSIVRLDKLLVAAQHNEFALCARAGRSGLCAAPLSATNQERERFFQFNCPSKPNGCKLIALTQMKTA